MELKKDNKRGHNPGLGICSFALVAFLKWVTGANRSFHSLPKEQLKQNERITQFNFFNTRAIRSLWKSYWLFLRANHSFVVLNNTNSSLFSLFEKRAKERFALFSKKPAIHTTNQRANSQPWHNLVSGSLYNLKPI